MTRSPQPPLVLSQDLRRSLEELGQEFMLGMLEADLERHPDNVAALAELGQLYTTRGQWERGLAVDERLVRLIPADPTAHYNLACSRSLLGQVDDALESLERAVALGYDDDTFMARDEDLAALRGEQRFRALLERIRSARLPS